MAAACPWARFVAVLIRFVPGLSAVIVANGARWSAADENGREIG